MRMTTEEMIEVMQAYLAGKTIEFRDKLVPVWYLSSIPSWDWALYDYRVKEDKLSIDWSHVNDRYNWMAMDEDGTVGLYSSTPKIKSSANCWYAASSYPSCTADVFKSLVIPVGIDWKKSLICRPGVSE